MTRCELNSTFGFRGISTPSLRFSERLGRLPGTVAHGLMTSLILSNIPTYTRARCAQCQEHSCQENLFTKAESMNSLKPAAGLRVTRMKILGTLVSFSPQGLGFHPG